MRSLTVGLDYKSLTSPKRGRENELGIALPVKVLDADGSIIADALTSLDRPAEFRISDEFRTVFVRLAWPSGKTETKRVNLQQNEMAKVVFTDTKFARNEWSAWATPLLNSRASRFCGERSSGASIEAYLSVWLRIWQFDQGKWHQMPINPLMQYKNDVARQMDLDLVAKPHLLQVGGPSVPWRFIALPSSGPCRILLTPNDSKDPRADPLKIVVTSFRTSAETLLEFLARDAVRAANTMVSSVEMAISLFEEKFHDPLAALIGAYYLLRIEDWDRVPLRWWQNLSGNFSWIPDTAIVHCVRLLRAGLEDEIARVKAITLFKACVDRGWPVYEEGLQLLQEAGSLLRHISSRQDAEYFAKVESLVTAKTWAGAALSFYGKEPSRPSAVLWVGMPNAPRRRRLSHPAGVRELIQQNQLVVEDLNLTMASKVSRQMSSLMFAKEFVAQRPPNKNTLRKRSRQESSSESFEESENSAVKDYWLSHEIDDKNGKKTAEPHGNWLLLGDIGN